MKNEEAVDYTYSSSFLSILLPDIIPLNGTRALHSREAQLILHIYEANDGVMKY